MNDQTNPDAPRFSHHGFSRATHAAIAERFGDSMDLEGAYFSAAREGEYEIRCTPDSPAVALSVDARTSVRSRSAALP